MKTTCLKTWELAAYMRHKKLLVVRPVKPRRSEMVCSGDCSGPIIEKAWRDPGLGGGEYLKVPCGDGASQRVFCPFGSIGEVLGLKEPWSSFFDSVEDGGVGGDVPIYRATYAEDFDADPSEVSWHPAVTMPAWAVRHKPVIESIRVMRVGEITAPDAVSAGAAEVLFRDANDPVRKAAFARGTFDCERWDQTAGAVDMFLARWEHEYPTHSWAWGIELREGL